MLIFKAGQCLLAAGLAPVAVRGVEAWTASNACDCYRGFQAAAGYDS